MIAIVEVSLATSRPPGEHRTVHVIVSVDVIGLDVYRAEVEAELIAVSIAMVANDVVMPVRSQILEIAEI